MIELDGRSYTVDDPTTNAFNLLGYVNQFMIDNDVRNSRGEVVEFKVSLASPIWLIIIGVGYIATICQKIMYACAQAFNIGSCSEKQLLDLARIARIKRKEGSYTTVVTTVTATELGSCGITTDMMAVATYDGVEYMFHPMQNVLIQPGQSEEVILICTLTGPVFLEAGAIETFTTIPENFGSMTSLPSQPGENMETIASLRTRVYGNESVSPLEGAIQAVNALDGITKAVVFYNSYYDTSITVANKVIPPKQAIMFVQGYSSRLAQEYFKHMSAQTVSGEGSVVSQYVLSNGQTFTLNYFPPQAVELHIRVKLSEAVTAEREEVIKRAVSLLSNSLNIGKNYTQSYILDSLGTNLNYPEITGCMISVDGEHWSDTTNFNESNVGLLAVSRVTIVTPDDEE